VKQDQLVDGDQLLDLNEINDAFKKMPDLESKWIAPLGKPIREILANVDYDEPSLSFSEDMQDHVKNLQNTLHTRLFKN